MSQKSTSVALANFYRRGKRNRNLRLILKEGTEGPLPWTEYVVRRNDHEFVLRCGALGYVRYSIDGRQKGTDATAENTQGRLQALFLKDTGFTISTFMRIYERLHREDQDDPMGCAADYI